jgi:hypothetical protein
MAVTAFADLEIRVLPLQPEGYPVELTLDDEREFPRGFVDASLLPWESGASSQADGDRLFAWLTADPTLRAAWTEARATAPQRRIRLRIDAAAPELHALPWELLRDSDLGIEVSAADATPFSRYLAGAWQPGSPILQRPLKMLVAVAAPANLADLGVAPLDAVAEFAALRQGVAGLNVEVTVFPAKAGEPCTLAGLEAELRRGYHIVHLVCHGVFDPAQGSSFLVLAGPDNTAALVPDTELVAMLARHLSGGGANVDNQLRLVYLDACESATRSTTDAFVGAAPRLVQAGVPAVVAMQTPIRIDVSRAFAAAFYAALLDTELVDLACNRARAALLSAGLPGFEVPALFLRLRSGRLVGRRGEVRGSRAESFWATLLGNIEDGLCTPFLGPGVTAELLPTPDELAQLLAAQYHYPFAGERDLPRVAQFVATTAGPRLLLDVRRAQVQALARRLGIKVDPRDRTRSLADVAAAAEWGSRSRTLFEDEPHHLLAELELPLYITTNCDSFMALALQQRLGKPVRRVAVEWQQEVQPQAARPYFDFDPPAAPDDPVVLHLFGFGETPESVVLGEDSYLDYLARIARDYQHLLPTSVNAALASTTLLFLGYRLEDLDMKVILRGLLPKLDLAKWGMLHVAVQLEADPGDMAKETEVREYLQRYFSKSQIDVYWGSTQQFIADLHVRWQERRQERDQEQRHGR